MKKLISLLLALLLATGIALAEPATEESAALTYEELEMYLDELVKEAMASGEVTIVSEENSVSAVFSGATLRIADETLSENTAVLSAVLSHDTECPRGLKAGDTLAQLLAAYPNDNATLSGTYFDAALYVAGEKPVVTVGWLLRDGQRVTEVTHCVYHWLADGVIRCGVRYTLDQGTIIGIEVFGLDSRIEESEALSEVAEVADMQEFNEYFAYPQSEDGSLLSPFEREDLSFAGMDFLDLTVEMATEALGSSPVDEWTQDSTGEYLRLKQWDGVSILFVYDANKQFLRVDSLTVNDDVLEGPRGVRVGDWMDSVLFRFRHSEGGTGESGVILYGDGQTAPYGVLTYSDETTTLTYTLALDEKNTVIWHLTFVDAKLQSMNLLLR